MADTDARDDEKKKAEEKKAIRRIMKELSDIEKTPIDGTRISWDDTDVFSWRIDMDAPPKSVYAGGTFRMNLTLSHTYPFQPPVLAFATKIYHPKVSNDGKGAMCIDKLKTEEWKPAFTIAAVLRDVRDTLASPDADFPVEADIARQLMDDRPAFERTAREWVAKYAKGAASSS